MTGQKIFDTLPEVVQKKIMKNAREMSHSKYNNFLYDDYNSLREFIGHVFLWVDSPEGNTYWYLVSRGEFKNLEIHDEHNEYIPHTRGFRESISD